MAIIRIVLSIILLCSLSGQALAGEVKIAVFPSNDPAKLQEVMDVLAEYLSEKTGDDVTAVVTRDYDELADRLRNRSVDIAWINTLNYIRIKDEIPSIKYIATYMEKNEHTGRIMPYYQAYVLALSNSTIRSLDDLRGRRFAFTDESSTSGYAYPALMLRKMGIDPRRYFRKVFFLKQHDRVIEALLRGSIDGGAVSDGTYFTAVDRAGDKFAILAKSDPIPLDAIVAPPDSSAEFVEKYRQALVSMPSDHSFCHTMKSVLGWSAAGFDVRGDSFYDTAREALK